VMEATLETKAETILEFVHGLRGSLHVSFEEGTCAAWLHDLLKPHVTEVLVCDSRKNALLRVGNKNDREDARKLSEQFLQPYCLSHQKPKASSRQEHDPAKKENPKSLPTSHGLESRAKIFAPSSRRGVFSLDSPLYRTRLWEVFAFEETVRKQNCATAKGHSKSWVQLGSNNCRIRSRIRLHDRTKLDRPIR
jgi:hypothetical protein